MKVEDFLGESLNDMVQNSTNIPILSLEIVNAITHEKINSTIPLICHIPCSSLIYPYP